MATRKKATKKKVAKKKARRKKKAYLSHHDNPDPKCKHKSYFQVTQVLLLMLQKMTGKQTHEIMNDLIEIYENTLKDYEIDPNSKTAFNNWRPHWGPNGSWAWRGRKEIRRTIEIPDTNIYMNIRINGWYTDEPYDEEDQWGCNKKSEDCIKVKDNTNVFEVSFYLPQRNTLSLLNQDRIELPL